MGRDEQGAWNDDQDKSDRIDVEIRDWARDAGLYSPKTKLNAAAGGVAGALIGAVIVFILEWLQASTVRSPQDLERLDVPALGTIPVESGSRRRRRS